MSAGETNATIIGLLSIEITEQTSTLENRSSSALNRPAKRALRPSSDRQTDAINVCGKRCKFRNYLNRIEIDCT